MKKQIDELGNKKEECWVDMSDPAIRTKVEELRAMAPAISEALKEMIAAAKRWRDENQ